MNNNRTHNSKISYYLCYYTTCTNKTSFCLIVWLLSSNRHCLFLFYTHTTHTHKNNTPNKSLTRDAVYNIIILHSREIVLCVIIAVVIIIIINNKIIRTIPYKYVKSMRLTFQCIVRFQIKQIKLISNVTTVADYRVSIDYIVIGIVENYNRFGWYYVW